MNISLRDLDSFGGIAAEDEPVLDYFLSTPSVDRILTGDRLLVLGRKGSGKTALVTHFTESNAEEHGKPLSLKSYPWTAHSELVDKGASETEAYVASWKLLIAIRMASHVVSRDTGKFYTDSLAALRKFLLDNFGSLDPDTRSIVQHGRMSVEALTIAPQLAGTALGSINLRRKDANRILGAELNALTTSILNDVTKSIAELGISRLFMHFDELDQGLDQLDEKRTYMLIGLILAAREISNDKSLRANISPVVYLRTDIWDQLAFSDKNKISRQSTESLVWDADSLLQLVNIRIRNKLGDRASWKVLSDDQKMRGSQTKFNHIVTRTFLRPRDVIQFLNEALSIARKRDDYPLVFVNEDINAARVGYSDYLKDELDDEIKPHWPQWAESLAVFSKSETITFQRSDFLKFYPKIRALSDQSASYPQAAK